jgi:hypothetical protein
MSARFVVPGVELLAASAVLYGRAGYGPLADKAHRGNRCTADRCVQRHLGQYGPLLQQLA